MAGDPPLLLLTHLQQILSSWGKGMPVCSPSAPKLGVPRQKDLLPAVRASRIQPYIFRAREDPVLTLKSPPSASDLCGHT